MNYTIRFPIILNELTDVWNNQLRDHIMFGKNYIFRTLMPIKYMGQCSEHKASFVPNICSEVELFRTYKLPSIIDAFLKI